MVRDPVRGMVCDGLGNNIKKLRLLRKWFAMVRDLPDVSRVRMSEQERICTDKCNGSDRGPVRAIPKDAMATYAFTNWPAARQVGVLDEDLLHGWEEREAICIVDGGLNEQEARRVAWEELLSTDGWCFAGPTEEANKTTAAGTVARQVFFVRKRAQTDSLCPEAS